MRYRIIFYNRTTDLVGGTIDIPGQYLPKVLAIAGIGNARDPGEYPLEPKKIIEISALLRFKPDISRYEYHLEPLEDWAWA